MALCRGWCRLLCSSTVVRTVSGQGQDPAHGQTAVVASFSVAVCTFMTGSSWMQYEIRWRIFCCENGVLRPETAVPSLSDILCHRDGFSL